MKAMAPSVRVGPGRMVLTAAAAAGQDLGQTAGQALQCSLADAVMHHLGRNCGVQRPLARDELDPPPATRLHALCVVAR